MASTNRDQIVKGLYRSLWPHVEKCDNHLEKVLKSQEMVLETLSTFQDELTTGLSIESETTFEHHAKLLESFPLRIQQLYARLKVIKHELEILEKA